MHFPTTLSVVLQSTLGISPIRRLHMYRNYTHSPHRFIPSPFHHCWYRCHSTFNECVSLTTSEYRSCSAQLFAVVIIFYIPVIVAQRPSRSLTNSASILVGFPQNLQGSHHPHPNSALYFPMTNQQYQINMHTL